MAFVATNMNKKPTFDDAAYLKLRERRLAAQAEERKKAEASAEKETAAPAKSSGDSYTSNYLKLRAQRLAEQSGTSQNAQATPSDTSGAELPGITKEQRNTDTSVDYPNSGSAAKSAAFGAVKPAVATPDPIAQAAQTARQAAEKARREYAQAKGSYQQSGQSPMINMAAAAQPGSNYQVSHNIPTNESPELQALREKADAAQVAADQAAQDYRMSRDQKTYEQDMQKIQSLSSDAQAALETYARLYKLARNSVTQTQYLSAQRTLRNAGMTDEQMDALAETWTRSRNAENMARTQTEYAAMAEENPILHNALSIPAGIAGALTGTSAIIGEAVNRSGGSRYSTLDPNLPGYIPSVYTGTVRQTTSENIDDGTVWGKAGATLYSASMSAVDNLARIVALGPTGSLAFAGMSSFQDSVRDVTSRGGTPAQAYAMGIATAGLEIMTEKVSLDSLISTKTPKNFTQLLKNIAIQGGIEASEEELNFAGGLIADAVIMGGNSQYNRSVADMIAGGMSAEEAKSQAFMNNLSQAANVAAQSFLSGGIMSGGQAGFQVVANGGFGGPQAAPESVVEQKSAPAESPVQTAPVAPAQPVQTAPQTVEAPLSSRYVAPDGLRYEDMTPAQQLAAEFFMAAERLKNGTAYSAPVENADNQQQTRTTVTANAANKKEAPQFANAGDPGATPGSEFAAAIVNGQQSTDITSPGTTPETAAVGTSDLNIPRTDSNVNGQSPETESLAESLFPGCYGQEAGYRPRHGVHLGNVRSGVPELFG